MSNEDERQRRERAIVRVIESRPVRTQAELIAALTEEGLEVTQATVSRDIRRLGLVKAPRNEGGSQYRLPSFSSSTAVRAVRDLSEFVISLEPVEALLAVRTLPGRAMAVATAIDETELAGVTGTLAGDDTVLVMIARREQQAQVQDLLSALSSQAPFGEGEGLV